MKKVHCSEREKLEWVRRKEIFTTYRVKYYTYPVLLSSFAPCGPRSGLCLALSEVRGGPLGQDQYYIGVEKN